MSTIHKINRRDFLKLGLGTGAGLALGFTIASSRAGAAVDGPATFSPNAFLRIGEDHTVTVIAKHLEMGQGSHTGLATLVAEELDAAWEQVRVEGAPADAGKYNNLFWGPVQGTGGSNAIANSWEQMRKAGATARAMLVAAAAHAWGVDEQDIRIRDGVIGHAASGQRAGFGDLAAAAGEEIPPEQVTLKRPSEFRLIGRSVERKDTADKINGRAVFTQDVQLPGMLTALTAHPPRFGAKLKRLDDAAARAVDGVEAVIAIPSGVAVAAKDFWSAKRGRDALKIQWDESAAFKQSSEDIFEQYAELAAQPGAVVRNEGGGLKALEGAGEVVTAEYRYPFLAHAAMEPMNCVVHHQGDRAEVWNGEQMQTLDQARVAGVLGLKPDRVKLNMLYAGGSFGRRANPDCDYIVEAAHIAKALPGRPVKLVWTREDDMRAGWYRPLNLHRLSAVLGPDGLPHAWHHRIVGQSVLKGTPFEGMLQNGIDPMSVEGAGNQPYRILNQHVDLHSPELGVPVQWWRSVGSTHTAYSVETFIDRLAAKADRDPVEYRLALLKDHPRHTAVLRLAADKAAWSGSRSGGGAGKARGVAVHESFNSVVAMVADVSLFDGGGFRVDKVVIAVDCGIAVNPDVVRAQMEGGMGYGLAMALGSEITLDGGRVVQGNFHDYHVPRMPDMPDVDVHILASTNPPTGVGEPATPVIAPAVANAIAAATGVWHGQLPIRA